MSNRDALVVLDALQSSPRVCVREEAPVFSFWRTLAAFALAGGLRLATLDGDFRNFISTRPRLDSGERMSLRLQVHDRRKDITKDSKAGIVGYEMPVNRISTCSSRPGVWRRWIRA